jgi:hypothetical protein
MDDQGCPGEDTCEDLKMDPAACDGCPKEKEPEISTEAAGFLEYDYYLFELLEMIEMGLQPEYIHPWDKRFLVVLNREKKRFQNETMQRQIEEQRKEKEV